jgi:hypothetical protein
MCNVIKNVLTYTLSFFVIALLVNVVVFGCGDKIVKDVTSKVDGIAYNTLSTFMKNLVSTIA